MHIDPRLDTDENQSTFRQKHRVLEQSTAKKMNNWTRKNCLMMHSLNFSEI